MQKILRLALCLQSLFLFSSIYAQQHPLIYYSKYSNDAEIQKLFDSVNSPIIIYKNNVMIMNPECKSSVIPDRNIGWDVNIHGKIPLSKSSRNIGWDVNAIANAKTIPPISSKKIGLVVNSFKGSRNIGWDVNSNGKSLATLGSRNIGWDLNGKSSPKPGSRNTGWDVNAPDKALPATDSRNIGWDANVYDKALPVTDSRNIGWDINSERLNFTCHLNKKGTVVIKVYNNITKAPIKVFNGTKFYVTSKRKFKI